jgi:hypothetical protein
MSIPHSQLIQIQNPSPGQSVSVWKELGERAGQPVHFYRKVWLSKSLPTYQDWLYWAHHEHLILTLLANRGAPYVVQVSGLQVEPHRVELVTVDAGPDFQRNWISGLGALREPLLPTEIDALKVARACLKALSSIHRLGLIHGDFKSDNICIAQRMEFSGERLSLDLQSFRMIDFAYSVYQEQAMRFVLPTDPDQLLYMPDFYRDAIRRSQSSGDPTYIQSAACAQVDLYCMYCLLKELTAFNIGVSGWKSWQRFMKECERICAAPSFVNHQGFDEPTSQLLRLTESFLETCAEPRERWTQADTNLKELHESQCTPCQTPALTVPPTPLIQPLHVTQPSSEVSMDGTPEIAYKQVLSVPDPGTDANNALGLAWNTWIRTRWLFTASAIASIFLFIDRSFVAKNLKISDWGFVFGLSAFVFAVPFIGGVVWRIFRKSRAIDLVVRLSGLALCGVAIYFLFDLFPVAVTTNQMWGVLLLLAVLIAALLV